MSDRAFALWSGSIMLFFLALVAIGVLGGNRAVTWRVTPGQLDSALVEAAYRLLSERDSIIRECAARLGPLNPECRL